MIPHRTVTFMKWVPLKFTSQLTLNALLVFLQQISPDNSSFILRKLLDYMGIQKLTLEKFSNAMIHHKIFLKRIHIDSKYRRNLENCKLSNRNINDLGMVRLFSLTISVFGISYRMQIGIRRLRKQKLIYISLRKRYRYNKYVNQM